MYSHVCDGEHDCQDGSDEEGCEKQCKPGLCYALEENGEWVCKRTNMDVENVYFPHQDSSSVLMGENASNKSRCVMGRTTVRTIRMKQTAQNQLKAAITFATIRLAVFQRTFFVMEKRTALMGQMKINVVGAF